jgi:hypothetical protein
MLPSVAMTFVEEQSNNCCLNLHLSLHFNWLDLNAAMVVNEAVSHGVIIQDLLEAVMFCNTDSNVMFLFQCIVSK